MLYSEAMKTILKKTILISLIITLNNSIVLANDTNTDDNSYKPNMESIAYNEQGVAVINKDPEKAAKLFQKALSVDNKNISALLNYATLKISEKKGNEVTGILEAYRNSYPKISDIHYLLGDIYFADKQIDKALDSYKKVLILKPSTNGLFAKLGNIYLLKKELSNAEFMYEQAYKNKPKDTSILNNYANILLANHKVQDSFRILKESLNIQDTPEGNFTLATIYEIQKDIPSAVEYYKKARALGSKQEGLDKKIEELSNSVESF